MFLTAFVYRLTKGLCMYVCLYENDEVTVLIFVSSLL